LTKKSFKQPKIKRMIEIDECNKGEIRATGAIRYKSL
jgi:hypothetical protein